MEERLTCATFIKNNFDSSHSFMCKHCSNVKFNEEQRPYWACNKYNILLKDNETNYLLRCKECLENGDD